jgi:aldose 1-epimerase
MGAIAGRVANRIARGRFTLDGKTYQLACNNGRNHLHGGPNGWAKVFWDIEGVSEDAVRLKYHSRDGDEHYPGNVIVTTTYSVDASNTLVIEIAATTDAPTLINPTNHCYFNLHQDHHDTILDHDLQINADHFTPSDEELIPTGEIISVENTPMDFRKLKKVGQHMQSGFEVNLRNADGYDHNYVLDDFDGNMKACATLSSSSSGIMMAMSTNQPGLQLYTGNALSMDGRNGVRYQKYSGICLEAQGFPDAINHDHFPSIVLRPGEQFFHRTEYRFL